MLVSIGPYELCNGTLSGGVAIGNLRFGVDRTIEIVVALPTDDPWLSPITFDRLSRVVTMTFQVQRVHVSSAAAALFILGLDTALPSTGYIVVSDGATEFTIPNGKVNHHKSAQLGAMTTTQYTIIGGGPIRGSGSGSGSG